MPLSTNHVSPGHRVAANPVQHIPEFEGLRGVMAWWVVLTHMSEFAGYDGGQKDLPWPIAVFLRGGVPVDVFITLSGFVMFFLLNRSSGSAGVNYSTFIMGRIFRLYPVYLLALVLALLTLPLAAVALSPPWGDPQAMAISLERLGTGIAHWPQHMLLHLSMLHGVVPDQWFPYANDAILVPAWSLSLEMQFYLLAPFLFVLMTRNLLLWAIAGLAMLGVKWLLMRSGYSFAHGAFLPMKFEFFMLGMLSFRAWQRGLAHRALWPALWPLLAGLSSAFAVMVWTGGMREHFFPVAIWLVVFTAALWRSASGRSTVLSKLLCHPVAQQIGRVSYSTYITHMVLVFAVGAGMVHVLADHDPARSTVLGLMVLLCSPLILLASLGLYRFVEQPGIALGKTLRLRFGRRLVNQTV